jgi:hypothetical protein
MLRATALAISLLASTAPAAAAVAPGPTHVPVPAGQIQHTVTVISFPAAKNTHHHDGLRNERWIGATAGRELVTDTTTGKVREDCQYRITAARCWAAPLNKREPTAGTTHIFPGNALLLQSWIDAGANVDALIGDPRGYRITGSTTFLGRPAITLVQPAQRGPDGGTESASLIAEADNHYPLWRNDLDVNQPFVRPDGTRGKEQVDQVTTTKVMEVISPAGVKLTIARHPRAKVVDDRRAAGARKAPGYTNKALGRR